MKRAKTTTVFSLLAMLFGLVFSLIQPQASGIDASNEDLLGIQSNSKNFSLLDPSRLKMSHSYTFSYFSNSEISGSFGVYTTTLKYQLSNPLSLTLDLNYLHQPLSVFGQSNLRVKESILPNFQLHYKPSNNFSLWINVLTFPSSYHMNNRYPWP